MSLECLDRGWNLVVVVDLIDADSETADTALGVDQRDIVVFGRTEGRSGDLRGAGAVALRADQDIPLEGLRLGRTRGVRTKVVGSSSQR
jgi:hypothetical protein